MNHAVSVPVVDWVVVGNAERQLLRDVINFEMEARRIDGTTYEDKNPHYLQACTELRKAVCRYWESLDCAYVGEDK